MKVVDKRENLNISSIYLAQYNSGKMVEFADSLQPPLKITEKWVLIISTLFGCPVKCKMCDAGTGMQFGGRLSEKEIFEQIDYMIGQKFPEGLPDIKKFKIQFARMGEPSFNENVLNVLEKIPQKYPIKGLTPSISTIAPRGNEAFFSRLTSIKNKYYNRGNFQLQFSIHTTDAKSRDWLMPIDKWDFKEIADFGKKYYKDGDRKITLNFALSKENPFDPKILVKYFSPDIFLVKITPLNPTLNSFDNGLTTYVDKSESEAKQIVDELESYGYDVIVSIGETEENEIGSNCGQLVTKFLKEKNSSISSNSYNYWTK